MLIINRILFVLVITFLILSPAAAVGDNDVLKTPSFNHIKSNYSESYIKVLDRNNIVIDEIRTNYNKNQGFWLGLNQISPAVVRAVIYSEDKSFYSHAGVDWWAVGYAFWDNLSNKYRRGASTITMQLVGLIYKDFAVSGRRTYSDKIQQARLALNLERTWTKAQVLEAYLNLAPLKGELIGIDAVSKTVFKKHASGLDLKESSIIAAMLRSPNANAYSIGNSACGILIGLGYSSSCEQLNSLVQSRFNNINSVWSHTQKIARHFSRQALKTYNYEQTHSKHGASHSNQTRHEINYDPSAQVVNNSLITSLDAKLQKFAINSVQQNLSALSGANITDAAVVVLDNNSGEIISYIGSSGAMSSASQVDHARALRQAGSTLKPFLYAQAIGQKYITAASLIDNSQLSLATASGVYIPKNYDKMFTGWVSARTALAASLNIPAVKILTMVGTTSFAKILSDLGLELDKSGDFYGYSLALGSADISLLSLTNAYRALANSGVYSNYSFFKNNNLQKQISDADKSKKQVLDTDASWIVSNVLSDRQARVSTFGFDSPLSTSFWSAVKTGTSKDMRDNWTIGFSDKYTVGVWVGNSSGASMHDVSGVSGAGPIWQDIINYLHQNSKSLQALPPSNTVQNIISFEQNIEPSRLEFFINGTQIKNIQLAASKPVKIISPTSGTYIALDPDIPLEKQKLLLSAQGGFNNNYSWFVNDLFIGNGEKILWLPSAGEHVIKLKINDKDADLVKIYVKGLLIH